MAETTKTATLIYGGRGAVTLRIGDQTCIFSPTQAGEQPQRLEVKLPVKDGEIEPGLRANLARLVANGTLQVHGVNLSPPQDFEPSTVIQKRHEAGQNVSA
jgi:hypothetical protein